MDNPKFPEDQLRNMARLAQLRSALRSCGDYERERVSSDSAPREKATCKV